MLLVVDCGNTNTVFAVFDKDRMVDQWRCATVASRTGDEYFVWLKALMEQRGLDSFIDSVIVSSVVPNAVFNLKVLCNRYFDCKPMFVGSPECRLPISVRVDEGTQVGSDRLVNSVSAFDRFGGNLVVVDFGTATTFDVVDFDGAYIGGVIAPGVELSVKALHAAAAALPHVDVAQPGQVIGKNTRDCMHSGIFWGYTGLVEGICSRIKEEHDRPMKVIGTGGLAALFAKGSSIFDDLDLDLTIFGLAQIHNYNAS